MAEIHVLDKHTAELIAAGEVVERPASVVKELLENSIDAGASQITVSIESGGVRLIEISDNGTGIEAKYIPTAFIRHATSKIRTEDDLTSIHTLGFRGEALASIASVARVEVLTRTEADECASLYRIEGGEEQPIEPGARGVGTTIRVCDLFFNTPARMKFLKKDSSEGTFVADIVGHVALSHPEVSFKFIREGKLQYVTPGDGQLRSAAYAVLGREFSRDLVEVDNREGVYRVWGLITQPRSCRASRSMQYFYINGRYVRNRTMMAGMEMAFKGTTMQGKFPGGILLLEMPADLVDVNVHPAKTEVRFARENDIFDLVYHAVKLALSQPGTGERQFVFDSEKEDDASNEHENSGNKGKNAVKNNSFTGLSAVISGQAEPGSLPHPEEKPLRPAAPAASVTPRPTQPSAPERDILPLPVKAPEKAAPASEHTWTTVAASEPLPMNAALHSPEPPQEESVLEPPPFRAASSESQLDIEADIDLPDVTRDHMAAWEPAPDEPERPSLPEASDEPQQSAAPEQLGFDVQDGPEPLRYVGEIFRTYILAERGDEICIIDKHAAHERQLFEKLAAHYGDVPSQLLLEPLVVELSAEEKTALLTNLDLLESAGLEVSDFGGSSVCLRSVPADVEQSSAEDLLVELAAKLAHGSRDALNERTEWVLHSISCRAAIKAGDHTSPQELMALAEKILSGEVPPFCPHGRPCVLKLTRKELEKQFGRIV
jgi:DNA mismatch repair protein MutL